jgi:hypothetical protein
LNINNRYGKTGRPCFKSLCTWLLIRFTKNDQTLPAVVVTSVVGSFIESRLVIDYGQRDPSMPCVEPALIATLPQWTVKETERRQLRLHKQTVARFQRGKHLGVSRISLIRNKSWFWTCFGSFLVTWIIILGFLIGTIIGKKLLAQ